MKTYTLSWFVKENRSGIEYKTDFVRRSVQISHEEAQLLIKSSESGYKDTVGSLFSKMFGDEIRMLQVEEGEPATPYLG